MQSRVAPSVSGQTGHGLGLRRWNHHQLWAGEIDIPDSLHWPALMTTFGWGHMVRRFARTGVVPSGLRVSESGTPAMSVDVAPGEAFVEGQYFASDAAETLAVAAAHASLPRSDRIVLRLSPNDLGGEFELAVLTGTPASSPPLPALTQDEDAWEIPLARLLVPAAATQIVDADIFDERLWDCFTVPQLAPNLEQDAPLFPAPALIPANASIAHASHDTFQSAALFFLDREITADELVWRYRQGATALAGNYVFAIYDSSGLLVVDTGSEALSGANNAHVTKVATIATTYFAAGTYYVLFGLDSSAGSLSTPAVPITLEAGVSGPPLNHAFRKASGGVTAPSALPFGFSDTGGLAADTVGVPVPIPVLRAA